MLLLRTYLVLGNFSIVKYNTIQVLNNGGVLLLCLYLSRYLNKYLHLFWKLLVSTQTSVFG